MKRPPFVLFVDELLEGFQPLTHEALACRIGQMGMEAIWRGDPRLKKPDVRERVQVAVASKHEVGAQKLAPYPNLRMVSLAFSGYDKVDTAYLRRRRIAAYYAPDYSTRSVAELTLGLTIALLRRIPYWDGEARRAKILPNGYPPGTELYGKTVGILGIRRIGTETARRFDAFGCEVLGWARHPDAGFKAAGGVFCRDLDTLLGKSDVVVLHLPLRDKAPGRTRSIIGKSALARMRPGAVLVNTARGSLVDTAALLKALKEKRVAGAALDVYDGDPEAIRPAALRRMENVILVPHIGFKTKEALVRLAGTAIDNIGRFFEGERKNRLRF